MERSVSSTKHERLPVTNQASQSYSRTLPHKSSRSNQLPATESRTLPHRSHRSSHQNHHNDRSMQSNPREKLHLDLANRNTLDPASSRQRHYNSSGQHALEQMPPSKELQTGNYISKDYHRRLHKMANNISHDEISLEKSQVETGMSHRDKEVRIDVSRQHLQRTAAKYNVLNFPSAPHKRIVHVTDKSFCSSFCPEFLFTLCALLVFIPMLVLLLVLLPFSLLFRLIWRVCFGCISCDGACCNCCGTYLSYTERLWLHGDMLSPMVVQCLIFLESGLDTARIRDLINAKLISAENKHGRKLYPRFSQKIVSNCSGYMWICDKEFMISNHIFPMTMSPRTGEELQEYVSDTASVPLVYHQPLWQLQVLEQFGARNNAVLLLRTHPCFSDAASLVKIFNSALINEDKKYDSQTYFGQKRSFTMSVIGFILGPFSFLQHLICTKTDTNLIHGKHIHVTRKKTIAWSDSFSLSLATRIRQVTRCTLNDLLLSVAAGNVRTYLQLSGVRNPCKIKCIIPSICSSDKSLHGKNLYTFMCSSIPTHIEGAVPRIWDVKDLMDTTKSTSHLEMTQQSLYFTHNVLPDCLSQSIWQRMYSRCSCMLTSIQGPEEKAKFASKEVKGMMCFVPPIHEDAISITFFTYDNQIRMTVVADRVVLHDPEILTRDFILQMQNLSDLLANRRIPGEQIMKRIEEMHLAHANLSNEDCTTEQLQLKMSLVQQELHDLKLQLDAEGRRVKSNRDIRLINKIEHLKEEFREMMIESRKKKSIESDIAKSLPVSPDSTRSLKKNAKYFPVYSSDSMDTSDDDDIDIEHRRPFRKRALSTSSRLSTASVQSTARPLAPGPQSLPASPVKEESPFSYRKQSRQGHERSVSSTAPYMPYQQHRLSATAEEFEILELPYSPSLERKSYSPGSERRY